MGSKFNPETRRRAVRLVRENPGKFETEFQALLAVSEQMGMTRETLRRWVREAEAEEAERGRTPITLAEQNRELRRRNAELEQTIEILKAATSFFARECDPRPRTSSASSTPTTPSSGSHRSAGR